MYACFSDIFFFVDLNINRKFFGCKSGLNFPTFYCSISVLISEEQLLDAVIISLYNQNKCLLQSIVNEITFSSQSLNLSG